MSKRKGSKSSIKSKQFHLYYVVIPVLILFVILAITAGFNNSTPYQQQLSVLANSLAKTSENGCASWNGVWKYTDDASSAAGFTTTNAEVEGCSGVMEIFEILISKLITREDSFYAIMRKEHNTLVVWDYLATEGLPAEIYQDELVILLDGLAMLHLSVEDQREIVVTYSGDIFQWNLTPLTCKEVLAIHEMSVIGQILEGGISRVVNLACGL